MKKLAFAFAIVLAFASTSFALGSAHYAKIGGNGTNSGTYENPFTTWEAVNGHSFITGDKLYFYTTSIGYTHWMTSSGVYLNIDWDGAVDDRVVIGVYYDDGGSPHIGRGTYPRPIIRCENTGGSLTGGAIRYLPSSGSNFLGYITIEGIEVDHPYWSGIEVHGYYGLGGYIRDPIIRDCVVRYANAEGIAQYMTYNGLVENNQVYNSNTHVNGGWAGCSIDTGALTEEGRSMYNTVRKNYVYGGNEGISFYKGTRYFLCEENTVVNNRVPIYVANSRDGRITKNIVYRTNQDTAQYVTQNSGGIILDDEDNRIDIPKKLGNIEIDHNYIAGTYHNTAPAYSAGILLLNQSGDSQFGSSYDWIVTGINIHHNIVVDNVNHNIRFADPDTYRDVYVWANFFFVQQYGTNLSEFSPPNVSFTDPTSAGENWNFSNTASSGNFAATALPTSTYTLNKTTGWRSLPSDSGTVTPLTFAINELPANTCQSLGYNCVAYGSCSGTIYPAYNIDCEGTDVCCDGTGDPPDDGPSLNSSSPLATGIQAAYIFHRGAGTVVEDLAGTADGVLSDDTMWAINGVTMNAAGKIIQIPSPDLGTTGWSIYIAMEAIYSGSTDYAKFFFNYDPTSVRRLQLERSTADNHLSFDINVVTFDLDLVKDVFADPGYFHDILITGNPSTGEVKLYIDGGLEQATTTSFSMPTLGSYCYIGSKQDGTRTLFATFGAVYIWKNRILTAADASTLRSNYMTFINNPPTRTVKLGQPVGKIRAVNIDLPPVISIWPPY